MSAPTTNSGLAEGTVGAGTLALRIVGIALVYFVAGRLGLELAFLHASATAVWPPTGIAIASMLVLGPRVWPAFLLGAFAVNVTTAAPGPAALAIAVGNTAEAVVAWWALARWGGGAAVFDRSQTTLIFALVAMLATATSATIGVGTLLASGLVGEAALVPVWLTWWLGDMGGALLVAPILVLMSTAPLGDGAAERPVELCGLLAGVSITALAVFVGIGPVETRANPLAFLVLPFLVSLALRYGRHETALATVLVGAIAIVGTLSGTGPFARDSQNSSLVLLQGFLCVTALTTLTVSALAAERRKADVALSAAHAELEARVAERTEALSRANLDLRQSEARLEQAQALVHIGSWHWDLERDLVTWSAELYRIFGMSPTAAGVDYQTYLLRIHPEDRAQVDAAVRLAFTTRAPFTVQHRVVHADGTIRWVHGRGEVETGPRGVVAMHGTGQDVTERRLAEEERDANEVLRSRVDELARRTRQLAALNGMGEMLRASLTEAEALGLVTGFLRELFPEEAGALWREKEAQFEAVGAWGEISVPGYFTAEACWAVRRAQVHRVGPHQPGVVCAHLGGRAPVGALCVPMSARGETLGLLHLQPTGEAMSEYTERLAFAAAEQIASAVAALRVEDDLRAQALHDPLTGLYNRRCLDDALRRELARASRKGSELSLLMVDLDRFKGFNDRFGHAAGDVVLRAVSAALTRLARQDDVVCRYGGEEIVVVLSECSLEDALVRAEEIRTEVARLELTSDGQALGPITVSVGVATRSADGATPESLLAAADAAMYRAKAGGRDRVSS